MKKLTCLLLSFLIFVSPILAQNPCEDSTYLELKKKKLDGLWTMWYENGQMREEGTFKDGEKDGKWTYWSGGEAGREVIFRPYHKSSETTYKDGKLISEKCWDEDGNEMDCPRW